LNQILEIRIISNLPWAQFPSLAQPALSLGPDLFHPCHDPSQPA
jgi:hypothetical protein